MNREQEFAVRIACFMVILLLAGCGGRARNQDFYTFVYRGAAPRSFSGQGAENQALTAAVTQFFDGRSYFFGQERSFTSEQGRVETLAVVPAASHSDSPIRLLATAAKTQAPAVELSGDTVTVRLSTDIMEVVPADETGAVPQVVVRTLTYTGQLSAASLKNAAQRLNRLPGASQLPEKIESNWVLDDTVAGQPVKLFFKQDITAYSILIREDLVQPGP